MAVRGRFRRAAWSAGGAALLVVAALGVRDLTSSRPLEAATIQALQTLWTGQTAYRDGDKDGDGKASFARTLSDLGRVGLVDPELATGVKHGYRFRMRVSEDGLSFVIDASPLDRDPDARWFRVDDGGVITSARGAPAKTGAPLPAPVCDGGAGTGRGADF